MFYRIINIEWQHLAAALAAAIKIRSFSIPVATVCRLRDTPLPLPLTYNIIFPGTVGDPHFSLPVSSSPISHRCKYASLIFDIVFNPSYFVAPRQTSSSPSALPRPQRPRGGFIYNHFSELYPSSPLVLQLHSFEPFSFPPPLPHLILHDHLLRAH